MADSDQTTKGNRNVTIGSGASGTTIDTGDKIIQPLPPIVNPFHQLPSPPRDFTGRVEELEDLLANMKTGVAISGLQGLGGVGKTVLALKLAEHLTPRYPDAQFYLDLKGTSEKPTWPADAMAHVIRAYHPLAKLPEEEEELRAIYNSVLHEQRALLLMDNAADGEQIAPLLPPTFCALIVTSRVHFTLPGLYARDINRMTTDDARDLLLRIAPRIGDTADEIARLCGHLPLALRVAASALAVRKTMTPAEYVKRLSDEKQRLSHLKDVDVALSVSYQMIGEEKQKLWRALAVFPDTFDHTAAASVWEIEAEAAKDKLGDLFVYSLVEYDEEKNRYSLHDLARLFANERLSETEREALKLHHSVHYLLVLAQANQLYLEGHEAIKQGLASFDLERENIEAGWRRIETLAARDEQAARLCIEYNNAGVYMLDLRQHPREQIRWFEASLAAARRLNNRGSESNAAGNLGNTYLLLGETRKAIELYEQALVIDREIGDRRGESNNLGNLGIAYRDLGETRKAIEYQERALVIDREIGDRRGEGAALGNLGNSYYELGETCKAIEYQEQSLFVLREIGDRLGASKAVGSLGLAYASLGETRRAIELYEQQLGIAREMGDWRGEGIALWNMSLSLVELNERTKAIACAEEALRISEQIESPYAEMVRRALAEWRQSGEK